MLFAPILVSRNRTKIIHYYVNIFRKGRCKYFKLKSLVVSSWFSQLHFIYFANRQANDQCSFRLCPAPRIVFLASYLFFGPLCLKALVGLLLEQCFSLRVFCKFHTNWMIIHSLNSFFRDPLYDCIRLLYLYMIAMM